MTFQIVHHLDFYDGGNACACGHSECPDFEPKAPIPNDLEEHIIESVRRLVMWPKAEVQVGLCFSEDGSALWECQW